MFAKKKQNKKIALSYILSLVFLLICLLNNLSFFSINSLPDNFYTNLEEIENLNKDKSLGRFYSADFLNEDIETGQKSDKSGTVIFKLFGFIPIKKVKVEILPEEEVYVGGVPLGLSVTTRGALVVSNTMLDPVSGKMFSNKVLKNGDIIIRINDIVISNCSDIEKVLNENFDENKEISIEVLRGNKHKTLSINYIKNANKTCKLGAWVRGDLSGIGTLTFVKNNLQFAALGHPVTDSSGSNIVPIKDGNVYNCSLLGIEKGKVNKPGQLKCLFVQNQKNGVIDKNTNYGIVGQYQDCSDMIDANLTAPLGGRLSVRPGKATIISSVSGIREEYQIEIIKANYQKQQEDKSLVFKVVDKRLLALTGGIVQGMSGSPILQNGKLVGAVTHVFLKDPTKGYGVYADWMLKEMDD